MKRALITLVGLPLLVGSLSCATPLSTREKGAGIGALGGAAAGGIIGSAVRHPAAGALIGGALGLGRELEVKLRLNPGDEALNIAPMTEHNQQADEKAQPCQ